MPSEPPILDTMVLQAFVFGHAKGTDILLSALGVDRVRFTAEAYNCDEDVSNPNAAELPIGEFAWGIRSARARARSLPAAQASRYLGWLQNLPQLARQLEVGAFYVDPLELTELPKREGLMVNAAAHSVVTAPAVSSPRVTFHPKSPLLHSLSAASSPLTCARNRPRPSTR